MLDERIRVLIVDDDVQVLELMHEMLGSAGFAVREARDGKGALRELAANRPDVMILDLRIPVIDGHGVIAEMERSGAEIPTVVVSAFLSEERWALPAWVVSEPKPLELARVPDLIRLALERIPPTDARASARRIVALLDRISASLRDTHTRITPAQ